MKINLFKITQKGFFDPLGFINKNVSLNENVIKNYILRVMFYGLLKFNLRRWIYLERERVKKKFFKRDYNKVEFLS